MTNQRDQFFVVLGRRRESVAGAPRDQMVAVFDSLELSADFARSLVSFEIYCGEVDSFSGMELVARGSPSGEVDWVGSTARPTELERLFGTSPKQNPPSEREESIEDDEHLDWQV